MPPATRTQQTPRKCHISISADVQKTDSRLFVKANDEARVNKHIGKLFEGPKIYLLRAEDC